MLASPTDAARTIGHNRFCFWSPAGWLVHWRPLVGRRSLPVDVVRRRPGILRRVQDDVQRISDALDLPLSWLLGILFVGMAALVGAVSTPSGVTTCVAVVFGVVISLIGLRAALRPSRPFRLENLENAPWLNTTRRLGLFYMVGGVFWAMIALLAAEHS